MAIIFRGKNMNIKFNWNETKTELITEFGNYKYYQILGLTAGEKIESLNRGEIQFNGVKVFETDNVTNDQLIKAIEMDYEAKLKFVLDKLTQVEDAKAETEKQEIKKAPVKKAADKK